METSKILLKRINGSGFEGIDDLFNYYERITRTSEDFIGQRRNEFFRDIETLYNLCFIEYHYNKRQLCITKIGEDFARHLYKC